MTKYAWRWSIAGIATTMLGATALSGPTFAQGRSGFGLLQQFAQNIATPNHRGGGGGGGGGGGSGGGGTGGSTGQQPTDPGVRGGAPGAGGPLPGLSTDQLNFFTNAQAVFNKVDGVPAPGGLGPVFNLNSCGGCHAQPATGGVGPLPNPQIAVATLMGATNTIPSFITANGPVREARFIRNPDGTPDGGVHDLFTVAGRSDASGCTLAQPNFAAALAANNVIFRIPTPVFGAGLVENIADSGLRASVSAVAQQRAGLGISGHFNTSGNDGTITRFGWKAQNKSLLMFAGEAYNVEMGVTNELFPTERNETPGCASNPTPEDTTNFSDPTPSNSASSDFASDITNFAMFMRLLAPPTPATSTTPTASSSSSTQVASATASSAIAAAASSTSSTSSTSSSSTSSSASVTQGQTVFTNIGCAACHIPSQPTNPVGSAFDPTFSNVSISTFSDYAVHTMGTGLADQVTQGTANGMQFRTAPLWGIGQRIFFLHDGRTNDLGVAILQHASQGSEANAVISNYNMLSLSDKQALVNFLRSL
jgi:CxxC motif-containing protein (DUF1111 family)